MKVRAIVNLDCPDWSWAGCGLMYSTGITKYRKREGQTRGVKIDKESMVGIVQEWIYLQRNVTKGKIRKG